MPTETTSPPGGGSDAGRSFPGPVELGRGAVIGSDNAQPELTRAWPTLTIGAEELADPRAVVDVLHGHWLRREPILVVLACDPADLRAPQIDRHEPWQLTAEFEFSRERLQFLVWANSWDLRSGTPVWWWGRKAARLAGAREAGQADVMLADGTEVWIDGGPRQSFTTAMREAIGAMVHRESVELGTLTQYTDGPTTASLAPDQLAAVNHAVGPARIIAPAGSGKTRVLTERLRVLRSHRGWEHEAVATFAYNRRAVDELIERTSGLTCHLRTLNSVGLAIVNGSGGFVRPGGTPRREVIDEHRVRRIIGELITVPRQVNSDPYASYIEGLRLIRRALVAPEVAERTVDAEGLASLFDRYSEFLEQHGLIDFDGQQYEAIRVLLTDPPARAAAQRQCRHLLVDEFQDLTPGDVLLIRLLSAPAYDVFGVGDDDQVIYGFGGASPRFLVDFERYFPGAESHALSVNYRCPPAVVGAAATLLDYNIVRVAKDIGPAPGRATQADELTILSVDPLLESAAAADQLQAWAASGESYGTMAVLARVNSALLPIQVTCAQRMIACRAAIDGSILERTGIRTALAYLRIALNPGDINPSDINETIRRPSRRVARNVVDMATKRRRQSIAGLEALAARLSGRDRDHLDDYCKDLQSLADIAASAGTVEILAAIRNDIGLGTAMDTLDESRGNAERSTHNDDLTALEQVGGLHPDAATFELWLRQVLAQPAESGGVELSTIHRVKGQEWDHVVVIGANADLFPHRLSDDVEEERRLLHVALTRGKRHVVVLADRRRPSPFVPELSTPAPPLAQRRIVRSRAATRDRSGAPGPGNQQRPRAESVCDVDPVVSAALKDWRTQVAKRDRVPAYVVFSDAYLAGIASARPATLGELARCAGVGPTKLERYGDEVLAVIETCADGPG